MSSVVQGDDPSGHERSFQSREERSQCMSVLLSPTPSLPLSLHLPISTCVSIHLISSRLTDLTSSLILSNHLPGQGPTGTGLHFTRLELGWVSLLFTSRIELRRIAICLSSPAMTSLHALEDTARQLPKTPLTHSLRESIVPFRET